MDFEHIVVDRQGGVLVAKLDNPPKNLMNAKMVEEIGQLIDKAAGDDSVRVVVFTGNMDGVFIQHYDVAELSELSNMLKLTDELPPGLAEVLHPTNQVFLKIEALPKPVIAAINGLAMGGGFELSLACDFRYLASNGIVGLPEATLGILPGAGGTQRLARLIGPSKALELMLVGEVVDAPKALALGMVNHVFEPNKLMEETMAFASRLAAMPPHAVAKIKEVVRTGIELPLEEALLAEQKGFMFLARTDDAAKLMKEYAEGDQNPDSL